MEKGIDSEEFVMSGIRPGFKREFAFVVQAQSIIGGSLGLGRTRTQTQKYRDGSSTNVVSKTSTNKRQRRSKLGAHRNDADQRSLQDQINSMDDKAVRYEEDEQRNGSIDVVQIGCGDASTSSPTKEEVSILTSTPLEVALGNYTNNIDGDERARSTLNGFPTKLEELLDTGILEDFPVNYIQGSKIKENGESWLYGVIKGSGILCYCEKCMGKKVVTPNIFELHAGSLNKQPAEYIFLGNGNSLWSVMNTCSNAPLKTLDEDIRVAIGSSIKKSTFCFNCKDSISEVGSHDSMVLCGLCRLERQPPLSPAQPTGTSDRSAKANTVLKHNSSANKNYGRVTKKDVGLHRLAFREHELPEGCEVGYFVRGKRLLSGQKKGNRILCHCCYSEVSPSLFEAHAGCASRRKPYLHIYTSNGVSLHELSVSLLRGREPSIITNDEVCRICFDGGTLLCCDGCPRVFHKECVSLENIPKGKWFCQYCHSTLQKGKFVERNINARAAGREKGVDSLEQIRKRCIRIIKCPTDEAGGCALCRRHEFSTSGFNSLTVMICDQCEKEFHVGCLKTHNIDDLKAIPRGKWFCCQTCKGINSSLWKVVLHGDEELPDDVLRIIKKRNGRKGAACSQNRNIKWRLLHGRTACATEAGSLLAEALSLFHEQFNPISDAGGHDLLHEMVHGRNTGEQDFGGVYCAILTVGSRVVSTALFRILGMELAELPMVATRGNCQGQGYFQALYACIERLLCLLQVKRLALPAAEGAETFWMNKFNFSKMEKLELNYLGRDFQMTSFQGTVMLEKLVPTFRLCASDVKIDS